MKSFWQEFKDWLSESRELSAWQEAFAKLATLLVMGTLAAGVSLLYAKFASPIAKEPDLVARIESLGRALTSAAKTIDEIEREVNQRRTLVDRLKQDAESASQLAALNKEQADAVAQTLRLQLEADQKTRFWVSVAQSAIFLILGLGLGELYRYVKVRIRRRRSRIA